MKIPKYVIDQARYRVKDNFGKWDIDRAKEMIDRAQKKIADGEKELAEATEYYENCVNLETELTEWLKSIGEYEPSEQSNS